MWPDWASGSLAGQTPARSGLLRSVGLATGMRRVVSNQTDEERATRGAELSARGAAGDKCEPAPWTPGFSRNATVISCCASLGMSPGRFSSPSVRWPCNSWQLVPSIFQSGTRKGFGACRPNSEQPTSGSTRRTVSVSTAGLSPVLGAAASPSSCTATQATSRIAVSASVRLPLPAPLF